MSPSPGITTVSGLLFSELNTARTLWFSLAKDLIAAATPTSAINEEFLEEMDIGALEQGRPESFVFETINGATTEATIIAWQVENAVTFAVNEKSYMVSESIPDLVRGLCQMGQRDVRWRWALNVVEQGFRSGVPVDNECVACVLSHYILNERFRSSRVADTYEMLLKQGIPFLLGFTYFGTSRAFGDVETAENIKRTLGLS